MKNISTLKYYITRHIKIDEDIDIFLLNVAGNARHINTAIIPENQIAEINRYREIRDVQKRLLARSFLYELLAINYGQTDFTLLFNEYKKPYLQFLKNIHFSLSYAKDYILVGVSDNRKIGVDIEFINPFVNITELSPVIMCSAEIQEFKMNSSKTSDKLTLFFKLFSAKEAIIKAFGTGLSYDVKTLHVHPPHNYTYNGVQFIYKDLNVWENQYTLAVCYQQ